MKATDFERVKRPDGEVWRYDRRFSRSVTREHAPAGPIVVVIRTHDLELAARMAEVRWSAFYPRVPMPEGVREWRRQEFASWRHAGRPRFETAPSTGTESRSFPVVAFRPVISEEAA